MHELAKIRQKARTIVLLLAIQNITGIFSKLRNMHGKWMAI